MKTIKFFFSVLVIVFSAAPLLAQDTIKLGVAGAHSGDLASYGIPSLNAARLVVAERNAKGGILGKQVEILAEDDVCKPEVATNTATKLASVGVPVVVGHVCSGATKAALDQVTAAAKEVGATEGARRGPYRDMLQLKLDGLGMPPAVAGAVEAMLSRQEGTLLLTGPSSSGKRIPECARSQTRSSG